MRTTVEVSMERVFGVTVCEAWMMAVSKSGGWGGVDRYQARVFVDNLFSSS